MKMVAEIGVTPPQVKKCLGLPKARRGKEGIVSHLEAMEGAWPY